MKFPAQQSAAGNAGIASWLAIERHWPGVPERSVRCYRQGDRMKKWNVYKKDTGEIKVVKEGFNWWAFFFGGVWAFTKGLTWAGIIGVSLTIMVNRMAADADVVACSMTTALMFVYGFMGNGWVAAKLEKQKYSLLKQVEAASADGAKAKFDEPSSNAQTSST